MPPNLEIKFAVMSYNMKLEALLTCKHTTKLVNATVFLGVRILCPFSHSAVVSEISCTDLVQ